MSRSKPGKLSKLLNFKWKNTADPEFQAFEHALFVDHNETDRVLFYLIGFGFLAIGLLPVAVCLVLRTMKRRQQKLLRDAPRFRRVTQKIQKSNPFVFLSKRLLSFTAFVKIQFIQADPSLGTGGV